MKKVLGDIVGGFPSENTPLMPPRSTAPVNPPPPLRHGPSRWRATAARGDIIIRYERVYEAANHSHVHISNGRSPRYSV
jgi:hypothetical protein